MHLAYFVPLRSEKANECPRGYDLQEVVGRTWYKFILFLILWALTTACTAPSAQDASARVVEALSGGVDESFARAYEPVEFQFPQDHGPHPDYLSEWWYYTGNLVDENGGRYGYQLTFFRSALAPGEAQRRSDFAANHIYMAHFAVTSEPANEHISLDRFSRGSANLAGASGSPQYEVWLEDWRVEQTAPSRYRLAAAAATERGVVAVKLTLNETRDPLLHGQQGLSQKSPESGNASYYYSLAHLDTEGTLIFLGNEVQVSGLSWMDHEYGTSALSENAVGWDWFSVTLDNGLVMMFAEIRSRSGGSEDIFEGTLRYPDGRQFVIGANDFELEVLGRWTSPETGISYPSGWEVTLQEHEIQLTIEPLIIDQEMETTFTYYEGATRIQGAVGGEPVEGRGYVELTGYGETGGLFQR